MKHSLFGGKAYSSLIRTLFYQTLGTLGVSSLIILSLRMLLHGKLADSLTRILCKICNVDWETGLLLYQRYIRSNYTTIVLIVVLIVFIVLFRISLSWFTRYFDQIVTGIDQLSNEVDEPIVMSPKLKFIETALNESNQKLRMRKKDALNAEQRKNELVVYLAHDIKTPLTSVIGYLSLLDETPDMEAAQKKRYTHIALKKAYRLESLINEFFEITRYNVNDIPLNQSNVDLQFMLVQITDELHPQFMSHGNEVKISIPEDVTICCDPDKMARALNNILKNAVAYSYPNTAITIDCEKVTDSIHISFCNRGQTIPEEKLSTLFEKFYRLDKARASKTGGAGLGLAIAKEIILRHKGTITAHSENDTVVFVVTLPLADS